jgi:hypothetical protein
MNNFIQRITIEYIESVLYLLNHNNPKYPKLIGITNGFLGKSLYRDILDVLKENRIKLKL